MKKKGGESTQSVLPSTDNMIQHKMNVYLILQVPNYLPSISAAIGGYVPQRNVWRISIALHAFPRFLAALAYFQYHMNFLVEKRRHLYIALAGLCTLLHMVENFALVVLTYISSLENRGKT